MADYRDYDAEARQEAKKAEQRREIMNTFREAGLVIEDEEKFYVAFYRMMRHIGRIW